MTMSRNSIESSSPRGSKCDGKPMARLNRSMSVHSADICRICHCEVGEGKPDSNLIAPCYCSGSLRFVHPECLQLWIKASDIKSCELCHFAFIMNTKTKPFSQWDRLDMSTIERRKVLCSVTFHIVAITCVVWSLYVLIDRTAEEARSNHLEWSFWTKLIVVAVGFTGGIVFMYVQCKTYVHLFKKWRAFNRVICVQNAPDKTVSVLVALDPIGPDIGGVEKTTVSSGDAEPCYESVVSVHNAEREEEPKVDVHRVDDASSNKSDDEDESGEAPLCTTMPV
ncbi:unnamed protein product [Notodromas monacha]|uniref:RING-CH-type domain-containing protein n=1 Tax=Notodromas monacha TaxID=399045 RepID=A0A7R9BHZ0_9CRUS|nr:unnamed protein product [Notodromas monacha]CAG0915828.1 unnamed protein product [Notodromas monacha]